MFALLKSANHSSQKSFCIVLLQVVHMLSPSSAPFTAKKKHISSLAVLSFNFLILLLRIACFDMIDSATLSTLILIAPKRVACNTNLISLKRAAVHINVLIICFESASFIASIIDLFLAIFMYLQPNPVVQVISSYQPTFNHFYIFPAILRHFQPLKAIARHSRLNKAFPANSSHYRDF